MTDSPLATQSLTPRCEISMPRPSTSRVSASKRNRAPSPQPTSRTRARGSTISATRTRSMRDCGAAAIVVTIALSCAGRCGRRRNAARTRGRVDETFGGRDEVRHVEKEGVVTAIRLDLDERHGGAPRVERMDESARIAGRKQPVGGEGDHAESRLRRLERARERAVIIGGEIEIIHRARHEQIGIWIKSLDKNRALMAKVGLDLEIGAEGKGALGAVLQFAAE